MPLARTYDASTGTVKLSLFDGYKDRLKRDSDIREYLPFLYEQARSRPGCRVLELGTRMGNSTLAFLAGAAPSGGHVWSVDVDNVAIHPDGMLPWRGVPQWTFTRGNDVSLPR